MTEEGKIFDFSPNEEYVDDRSQLVIFFQVLARKFWKLISVNLIYLLFNIPAILISFFIATFMVLPFMPTIVDSASHSDLFTFLLVGTFPILMFLMAVPVITVGPAQAGLSYLLRCYSYELPTFDWSDFKDKMKENLKQGLAIGLINLFAIVFLMIDFYLYSRFIGNSTFISIANGILIVVLIVFLMMNLYLYPMMVTYKLKLKDLYKNALLFSFAKFLPNLAVLILCFFLIMAPILLVNMTGSVLVLTLTYVFYIILGFSLPGYISSFFINPVIDKYINPINLPNKDAKEVEK